MGLTVHSEALGKPLGVIDKHRPPKGFQTPITREDPPTGNSDGAFRIACGLPRSTLRTFSLFLTPSVTASTNPTVNHPTTTVKMSAALNKIAANSPSRANPSELEQNIAQALYDLESNTADLKVALRPLQIVSAREVRTT